MRYYSPVGTPLCSWNGGPMWLFNYMDAELLSKKLHIILLRMLGNFI